ITARPALALRAQPEVHVSDSAGPRLQDLRRLEGHGAPGDLHRAPGRRRDGDGRGRTRVEQCRDAGADRAPATRRACPPVTRERCWTPGADRSRKPLVEGTPRLIDGGTTMGTSDRRGFLKGTAASLVVAGFAGAARIAAQTGGMKMKPTAQDVLLVIDVQNCFTPGGSLAVKEGDQIIPLLNLLPTGFEHVLLTQHCHTPGHVSFASSHPGKKPFETTQLPYGTQVLWPDHCVQGTPGAEVHKDLRIPHAELIIRKGYRKQIDSYSAFYEADGKTPTGLTGYLKDRGLNQVFLVGLATDFCVAWSAMD